MIKERKTLFQPTFTCSKPTIKALEKYVKYVQSSQQNTRTAKNTKIFGIQRSFTDHLRHKSVSKTTCRAPSANPHQLFANELKSFPAIIVIFLKLSGFSDLLGKVFLITFKFTIFDFSTTTLQKQCK